MTTTNHESDEQALRILLDLGAGGSRPPSMDQLRAEWTRVKRGPAELIDSVRRLVFAGLVNLSHSAESTALTLSHRGYGRARDSQLEQRARWRELLRKTLLATPRLGMAH